MPRTTFWILAILVFPILSSGCSRSENKQPTSSTVPATESPGASQAEGPPADVVQASALEVELTSGGKAEATVTVKVAEGYHINGNPSSKYQIPTALEVDPTYGISAGKAIYPPSESKKFSFSPDPLMVYEKEVVIRQPLVANADTAKGNHSLRGRLRVQPCNDTVCFPPRTLPVSIPVNVK